MPYRIPDQECYFENGDNKGQFKLKTYMRYNPLYFLDMLVYYNTPRLTNKLLEDKLDAKEVFYISIELRSEDVLYMGGPYFRKKNCRAFDTGHAVVLAGHTRKHWIL